MSSSNINLGDKLEQLIELTIPDRIINNFRKEKEGGCGCSKRKELLNNI